MRKGICLAIILVTTVFGSAPKRGFILENSISKNILLQAHQTVLHSLSFYDPKINEIEPSYFTKWKENKACVAWVDSVFNQLTWEERVAQFFMIAAYTKKEKDNMNGVLDLVKQHKIGGVIFFQGDPTAQAHWTNKLQEAAQVPLMVAIDGEWGLSMRLDSTLTWPRQMTLGACTEERLIKEMGVQIGKECKRVGTNINFAPVVDINTNPKNPVINERSFGEDKMRVSLKGLQYAEGLQQAGVMACAKHFPGHGDTDKDSHTSLPTVNKTKEQLQENELYPFRFMAANGVGSMMVAHLKVPALDPSGLPTSLSKKVVTDLLKNDLGFEGLIFSDALNMKGVSAAYPPATVDSIAFMAGIDILLFSENCQLGIKKILAAKADGTISEEDLTARVKKVLANKYLLNLHQKQTLNLNNIYEDLNNATSKNLLQSLYDNAMTIAATENNLLPFSNLRNQKVASLSIDCKEVSPFQNYIQQFAEMDLLNVPNESKEALDALSTKLINYETVILDLHGMSRAASKGFGVSPTTIEFINNLAKKTRVVLVVFGSPYSLQYFDGVKNILVAYEDNEYSQLAAANALFGGIAVCGKLPVSAGLFKAGIGFTTDIPKKLKIARPEECGLSSEYLRDLDDIALKGIIANAYPGCQIVVTKDGKTIWNKAYGNRTYDAASKVKNSDLYDLASISKIASTTLSVMKLVDEGKLDIHKTVGNYLTLDDSATIKHLVLADVLTHHAGLRAFFEFYKNTIDSNFSKFYRTEKTENFTIPVADKLFIRNDFPDTMWHIMSHSEVKPERGYLYSDLDFYTLQKVVESITKMPLEKYAYQTFYEPMGLTRMTYLPRTNFGKEKIAPTENDKIFRKQLVQGFVHDPGAAMYGGVAGHAGVFGSAFDLAQIMELLLNKGTYNGIRFFKDSTVSLFTKQYSARSRRGLGFDKPEPNAQKQSPTYDKVPLEVFGHTGFTGTCVWSDPVNHLTFVFLSNRVCPVAENPKLVHMGIRTDLQKIIYKELERRKAGH